MISKSKYVKFKSCPMALWLNENKLEVAAEDASAEQRMETGRTVLKSFKQGLCYA